MKKTRDIPATPTAIINIETSWMWPGMQNIKRQLKKRVETESNLKVQYSPTLFTSIMVSIVDAWKAKDSKAPFTKSASSKVAHWTGFPNGILSVGFEPQTLCPLFVSQRLVANIAVEMYSSPLNTI